MAVRNRPKGTPVDPKKDTHLDDDLSPSIWTTTWSFDIDGILTAYPEVWLHYISLETEQVFPSVADAKRALGHEYELLKHRYRLSDYKYEVPVLDDARELLTALRKRGDTIYVCTSRPFSEYPEMKLRTNQWLTEAGVEFDGLVEKTAGKLVEKGCLVHVDDEAEPFILFEKSGITCFLYDRTNSLPTQRDSVRVIGDLGDLMNVRSLTIEHA